MQVNYGWRYRRGMLLSSSIAESAVSQFALCEKAANAMD
jgi:hypothetical protein